MSTRGHCAPAHRPSVVTPEHLLPLLDVGLVVLRGGVELMGLGEVSSVGKTSGFFASSGSIFCISSWVPLTGGTYATYAAICAAIFGS